MIPAAARALFFGPALLALTTAAGCAAHATAAAEVQAPLLTAVADPPTNAKLHQALAGPQRTEAERARDVYRHPIETLESFGLREDMKVVEISPGGGWFTAVLAPVLRERGELAVVAGDPAGDPKDEGTQNAQALKARFDKSPEVFDKVRWVVTGPGRTAFGPPESADMVLTFRNFHNWVGTQDMESVLSAAYAVLKHGGVLGLTDHRAAPGTPADPKVIDRTGYVPEAYVVATLERAGFRLAGRSDVNANPRDTRDHPKGVWTLPPVLMLGDRDRAKYLAIGESDRMTLKFVKP